MKKRFVVYAAFAFILSCVVGLLQAPAFADEYPSKPITMIVAYSAGGGSDLAARTVAKYTEKYLGQPIVVENRPGAGGQMGFTALSKAKPDGYTMGMLNVPTMNIIMAVRKCAFDMSSFMPVANAIVDPVVLAVEKDSKFKTLKDFIEYAKANPEKVQLGIDGPLTNGQLQMLIMEKELGIKLKYVFYNGAAPALTAAIGGHTFGTTPGASEAQPYVENDQVRVLAVFSETRFPGLPDVPTFKEASGVDISYVPSLRGFGVPSGVPAEITNKISEAMKKAIADPEFQAKAAEIGLPVFYDDGPSFSDKIKAIEQEIQNFKDVLLADN